MELKPKYLYKQLVIIFSKTYLLGRYMDSAPTLYPCYDHEVFIHTSIKFVYLPLVCLPLSHQVGSGQHLIISNFHCYTSYGLKLMLGRQASYAPLIVLRGFLIILNTTFVYICTQDIKLPHPLRTSISKAYRGSAYFFSLLRTRVIIKNNKSLRAPPIALLLSLRNTTLPSPRRISSRLLLVHSRERSYHGIKGCRFLT